MAERAPLLVITYPRTASNLFMRMLSLEDQQETLSDESGGYFFFPAMAYVRDARLLDRSPQNWTPDEITSLRQKFQECSENLLKLLATAKDQRKLAVIKEHAGFMTSPTARSNFVHGQEDIKNFWKFKVLQPYSLAVPDGLPLNHCVLPDGLLLRCTPAFLIRHPALAFPSFYRVMLSFVNGDQSKLDTDVADLIDTCTLRWTRNIHDWYVAAWTALGAETKQPIILDADDIVNHPDIVLRFCELTGLDPTKVKFQWDAMQGDKLADHGAVRMHTRATLLTSSGIIQGNTFERLSIEGEVEKWKEEFGDSTARKLRRWVGSAMGDYEYLADRRLRPVVDTNYEHIK